MKARRGQSELAKGWRRLPWGAWFGPLSLALLFVALFCWTWRKWPDPQIDFGQQLYLGWQLSSGKLLQQDIFWPFGPFSQYVLAGWFRVAGVSVMSLVWFNVLVLTAIVAMVYRLVLAMADRTAATAAGLVFVGVFAFGQYAVISNYNYLTPYAEDATHGMAISLAALLLVWRYGRTGGRRCVAGIGICLGLLFLNKPEYCVSLLAGAGAGLTGMLWVRRAGTREWVGTGIALAGAAVVPVAAAWVWLAILMGPAASLSALMRPWAMLGETSFVAGMLNQSVLGLSDPGGNIRKSLVMLCWQAAVLAPAFLVGRRCRPGTGAVLIGLGLGATIAALLWLVVPRISWLYVLRPLPVAAAAIAVWAGRRVFRSRTGGEAGLAGTRLAASVFALALLGKMILNAHVYHYGFVLAMPATLLVVCALMSWAPSRLDAVGGAGIALRCATGILLAVFVFAHWRIEDRLLSAKVYQVGAGPDRFWADHRGRNINAAVEAVRSLTAADSRLFVMPEGAIINYLARRENPGRLLGFVPNGFVQETEIVRVLQDSRPEMIAITDRDVREFGSLPLGSGYGREVMALVNRDYQLVRQFGPSPFVPNGDGIALLARRAGGTSRSPGPPAAR
ncbi:MAG TPA: hypothetical protein VN317_01010 [Candidatus Methanoperedens sp.]|nr:hypothetical protein [Candidatus Methanoperedens sp.]